MPNKAHPLLGETFCSAHVHPVRCLIATTAKPSLIDERLQQKKPSPVYLIPLPYHAPYRLGENMRGKTWDAHPRHDEETIVVRHFPEVSLPLVGRPADETIPHPHLQRRRAPSKRGNWYLIVVHQIFERTAHHFSVSQVVIRPNQFVPQRFILCA